jgi:hypothetical protein
MLVYRASDAPRRPGVAFSSPPRGRRQSATGTDVKDQEPQGNLGSVVLIERDQSRLPTGGSEAVKGLIFNLLDSMARQSGCADEAWDLVMEFVASETEHEAQTDTCLSCFDQGESLLAFEAPADAMIQCLGNEASPSFSEFPELALTEPEDRIGDSIPALMDSDFALPRIGGPSPEGFSHDLLGLLEQLLAEALTEDEDGEDDPELDQDEMPLPLPASFARRSS